MNHRKLHELTTMAIAVVLAGFGCKTIVRENIISSINTGVGVSLTENPQTQLYEARVGYIRSQFYSIPTGKVVENGCSNAPCPYICTNAADVTPEVVAGIRVNTSFEHLLLGADISENFAVGKIAVKSRAATAMYIANAKNPETARAAQRATASLKEIDAVVHRADAETEFTNVVEKLDETERAKFFAWAESVLPGKGAAALATNYDKGKFVGGMLPSLNDDQIKILLDKLTQ